MKVNLKSFNKGAVLSITVMVLLLIMSISIVSFFRISVIKIGHVNEINKGRKAYWNSYSALSISMNQPRKTTNLIYDYNGGTVEITHPDPETKLARGTHEDMVREFKLKSN